MSAYRDSARTSYNRSEVVSACLEYFNGDELAANTFVKKYALKNRDGVFIELTPDDMHRRLAREFARIEQNYPNPLSFDEFYSLFKGFKYIIPQGSPMSAIGDDSRTQSLSNCFVIESPHDSYAGILYTDQQQAQIMKRRGGVGFDISNLRPKGMRTDNAAETTDGIEVFMQRYSNTCREVAQGGRRGALIQTISCFHPQIRDFINVKRDRTKVTGANISIKFYDEFMKAVEDDTEVTLRWPVDSDDPEVTDTVRAREIWDMFIDSAWDSAEPGAIFFDTYTRETPSDLYADKGFATVSTNPCSEIGMNPNDSCRLLLHNLTSYVKNPYTKNAEFDYELFAKHVKIAQRLLDDLVDLELEAITRIIKKVESDPEPMHVKRIELDLWNNVYEITRQGRRTGLGVTGLGDTLASLSLKYGTNESIAATEAIYKCLAVNSNASSVQMAKERGAFPIFEHGREKGHPFFERLFAISPKEVVEDFKKYGRRNICLTTTAPAGSVSILARVSSGVEPVLFLKGIRRTKVNSDDPDVRVDFVDETGDKWQEYEFFHDGVKKWMDVTGELDIEKSPYWGATINDIDWLQSVELQAAAQKWVEHSISKTCNLPENVSKDVVSNVYMHAWRSGCKGMTIYRQNSRSGVIVEKRESVDDQPDHIIESHAPKRPKVLPCTIHKCTIKGESWTILVGMLDGAPYEVFGGLSKFIEIPRKVKEGRIVKNGKRDGVVTYNLEWGDGDDTTVVKDIVTTFDNPVYGSFTRVMSLALRHGIQVKFICEQLQKDKNSDMTSFSRVMARVLKSYIPDGTEVTLEKLCPECGATKLYYVEGCVSCICGWRKCG